MASDSLVQRSKQLTWRRSAVAFSPDDHLLATGGSDDSIIRIWDVDTGRELQRFSHGNRVLYLTFFPDGNRLVSTGMDRKAKIWNVGGESLNVLCGEPSWYGVLAVSPDGQSVATAGEGHTVQLWNRKTGERRKLTGHSTAVECVVFSPDGRTIASLSSDGIRIWDLKTGACDLVIKGQFGRGLAFSSSGKEIASAGPDACVWDIRSGERKKLPRDDIGGECIAFSPDGRFLAVPARSGKVVVLDIRSSEPTTVAEFPYPGSVMSLSFSPDSQTIAIAGRADEVGIWNVETGMKEHSLRSNGIWHAAATFSPDGTCIVTVSPSGDLKFWSRQSGQELESIRAEEGLRQVAVSGKGDLIATVSMAGRVRVWSVATSEEVEQIARQASHAVNFTARGYARRGEWEKMFAAYEREIQTSRNPRNVLMERAGVLADIGRWEDALADYQRLIQGSADDFELRVARGNLLEHHGRSQEAIAEYGHAIDCRSDSVLFERRAWLLARLEGMTRPHVISCVGLMDSQAIGISGPIAVF